MIKNFVPRKDKIFNLQGAWSRDIHQWKTPWLHFLDKTHMKWKICGSFVIGTRPHILYSFAKDTHSDENGLKLLK